MAAIRFIGRALQFPILAPVVWCQFINEQVNDGTTAKQVIALLMCVCSVAIFLLLGIDFVLLLFPDIPSFWGLV